MNESTPARVALEMVEEDLKILQAEVRRLQPFEQWVRLNGDHIVWCPAKEKVIGKECTCGFQTLYNSSK